VPAASPVQKCCKLGKVDEHRQRVGPVLDQAIAAILTRADRGDTVSIKATLNHIRHAAPDLVASNEELRAILTQANLHSPQSGKNASPLRTYQNVTCGSR
jgi:hypothetical protein